MITKKEIKGEAVKFYKEWVEGEPLTQDTPVACYVEGAEYVLRKNKKNYIKAMMNLDEFFDGLSEAERLKIVNNLRLCAGMPLAKSTTNM